MTPAEKANLGLVQDIREEYGGTKKVAVVSGGARRKVADDKNSNQPSVKSVERVGDDVGRARGSNICNFCLGVCCSAMRHLINVLVEIGEVKPNQKVCLVHINEVLNLLLRIIWTPLNVYV